MAKVDRAKTASARLTGVPVESETPDAAALKSLHELARNREIKARLERLKSITQN
jgi:hypothetical protein